MVALVFLILVVLAIGSTDSVNGGDVKCGSGGGGKWPCRVFCGVVLHFPLVPVGLVKLIAKAEVVMMPGSDDDCVGDVYDSARASFV